MMKKHVTTLFFSLTVLAASMNASAADSRYSSWQPPAEEAITTSTAPMYDNDLQALISKLNALIDDADKARAADRRFIQDLRDLINQYDWPWQSPILSEDFTDGRVDSDTTWKVTSGRFEAERGIGLYSNVFESKIATSSQSSKPQQDAAALLIGAILDEALKTKQKQKEEEKAPKTTEGEVADIHVYLPITNAFAMEVEVDARSSQGRIDLGVFQGAPDKAGYKLIFIPGEKASIELVRASSRGISVIELNDTITAQGDSVHTILWTRNKRGEMVVKINDTDVIKVTDRGFRDAFDGFKFINQSGEFALRRIEITGT
jgi:hypothetical protein